LTKFNRKRNRRNKRDEGGNKTIGIIFFVILIGIGSLAVWYATARSTVDTGGIDLPNYAYRTSAVTQSYVAAVSEQVLFEYMPCYCGCVDMSHLSYNHRHLRDCFYDDSGKFSEHAAGCGTCIDIATTIWSMLSQGSSPTEIRNAIDSSYSGGNYPPPTDTPMPPM
jgi:hypothetical protein